VTTPTVEPQNSFLLFPSRLNEMKIVAKKNKIFYIQTGILNSRLNYYLINMWPSNNVNYYKNAKITKTKSK